MEREKREGEKWDRERRQGGGRDGGRGRRREEKGDRELGRGQRAEGDDRERGKKGCGKRK